jgi:hypothetical protein
MVDRRYGATLIKVALGNAYYRPDCAVAHAEAMAPGWGLESTQKVHEGLRGAAQRACSIRYTAAAAWIAAIWLAL